jgi:hypothetical protein
MRSTRVALMARFGSAAAVAGLALVGALAPASANAATPAHAHIPTHLWVRDHGVKGTHHASDVILGSLRARGVGLPNRTIDLFSRTKGTKWAEVGTAVTAKHGLVKFTVTPTTRTAYVLVFKGGPVFRHSHSAVVVLRAPKA